MKKRFLKLVNKVKETGIVETLLKVDTAEQFINTWNKFINENSEIAEEANKWALEYAIEDYKTLFSKNEAINDPIEIAIVIRLINNKYKVTEDEIFEMPLDLSEALRKFESDLVQRVAQIMTKRYIFKIRIKDIYD